MSRVAPTKTNLLKLRREHSFAREGHELLEQKKDILTAELLSLVDRTRRAEQEMDEQLRLAFYALHVALLRSGKTTVSTAAIATSRETQVSVSSRRVMGVALPRVEVQAAGPALSSSLGDTTFWIDEAKARFAGAAECLGAVAETRVGLRRLGREVKKTIRRVNALEKIALPAYERDLHYIAAVLEEMERQSFFTMKLLKNRLSQRRSSRGH